ncbi:thioredoxin reductase (NADPH) [Halarchaeum solikamskense]|uniref:NAD(P)/FAD-dependent oxidoreductase n=1 Tax=Halarchaeum nitratireducens TaxID=489913 RepID=UPI001B3AF19A|nr:FAD-dependent oxidoreductase [Halarchaeum solikamskense]MBP2249989.1 thioredoxin reductase (NADPH) [Halarchaeum solikamskense]
MVHDVLIIGTGPAGLAAGTYAGRAALDTLFFEAESIGGELVNRHEVESFPGFPGGVAGTDLRARLVEQVEQYEVDVELEAVEAVEPGDGDDPHVVRAGGEAHEAETVIVATGSHSERLGVDGEEEYEGRGIFHCATCDGPLYRGERIAVVGGGNHAAIDAVFLTDYASEVLLLTPDAELSADAAFRDRVAEADGLTVRTDVAVTEVLGSDGVVDGLAVVDAEGEPETIEIGGLNVNVGSVPNTEFLDGAVALDDEGAVVVGPDMESSVEGIFAAGDVRQDSVFEIGAGVGDGITAVESAKEYL